MGPALAVPLGVGLGVGIPLATIIAVAIAKDPLGWMPWSDVEFEIVPLNDFVEDRKDGAEDEAEPDTPLTGSINHGDLLCESENQNLIEPTIKSTATTTFVPPTVATTTTTTTIQKRKKKTTEEQSYRKDLKKACEAYDVVFPIISRGGQLMLKFVEVHNSGVEFLNSIPQQIQMFTFDDLPPPTSHYPCLQAITAIQTSDWSQKFLDNHCPKYCVSGKFNSGKSMFLNRILNVRKFPVGSSYHTPGLAFICEKEAMWIDTEGKDQVRDYEALGKLAKNCTDPLKGSMDQFVQLVGHLITGLAAHMSSNLFYLQASEGSATEEAELRKLILFKPATCAVTVIHNWYYHDGNNKDYGTLARYWKQHLTETFQGSWIACPNLAAKGYFREEKIFEAGGPIFYVERYLMANDEKYEAENDSLLQHLRSRLSTGRCPSVKEALLTSTAILRQLWAVLMVFSQVIQTGDCSIVEKMLKNLQDITNQQAIYQCPNPKCLTVFDKAAPFCSQCATPMQKK